MQDQSKGTKINSKAKAKALSTVPIKGMITKTSQVSSTIMQDQNKRTKINTKTKATIAITRRSGDFAISALASSTAAIRSVLGADRGSRLAFIWNRIVRQRITLCIPYNLPANQTTHFIRPAPVLFNHGIKYRFYFLPAINTESTFLNPAPNRNPTPTLCLLPCHCFILPNNSACLTKSIPDIS